MVRLNEQWAGDVLTGLVLVVDHRAPQRVWVLATVDTGTALGHALCEQLTTDSPFPTDCTMTIEKALEMVGRGECNFFGFSGTDQDRYGFKAVWPAGLVA